jgi:hypothetical protein
MALLTPNNTSSGGKTPAPSSLTILVAEEAMVALGGTPRAEEFAFREPSSRRMSRWSQDGATSITA